MVVTLERASLRKNQVQGVRGQEHGEQTPNQAEIDSKVAACWGPLGHQLGHERWWRHMQRDDTRQRRRDCSENPNWRTDRLEEGDRWTDGHITAKVDGVKRTFVVTARNEEDDNLKVQ